jgi:hypothetical protein
MANQAQLEAKITTLTAEVAKLTAIIEGSRLQVETKAERNATTTTTAAPTTTTTGA